MQRSAADDSPSTDPGGTKPAPWPLRLFLSLSALVVFAALAEWALWAVDGGGAPEGDPRSFEFQAMPGTIAREDAGRYVADPERFFTTAPDYRFKETHIGRYATGAWPYRGRPAEPGPADMARIAVIGDSCVYGAALDVSAGLSHQIARGLAEQGHGPDRVAVLTFGVPGYSTFQLRRLVDEVVERYEPTAVILYPAAWNDQGAAVTHRDSELARRRDDPTVVEWLDQDSRLVAAARALFTSGDAGSSGGDEREAHDGVEAERRVSPEELEDNLRAMFRRLQEADVPALVVSPAHPERTLQRHPGTGEDSLTVQRVAAEMGMPALNGQQILQASDRSLSSLFVDYVHPSPDGASLLADAILRELLVMLGGLDLPAPDPAIGIVSVQPGEAYTFGDDPLTVELSGWSRADPLPVVIVAGAPLLDLYASGEHAVTGRLIANGPGLHDVVVQSSVGCAVLKEGLRVVEPSLSMEHDGGYELVLHARPGDRARLCASKELRDEPEWSNRGAYWLGDATKVVLPMDLVADETGTARMRLPPSAVTTLAARGRYYLQGLVSPRGEGDPMGPASRWSPPIQVTAE